MIYERQNIGDRTGNQIPMTAFSLDDEEFAEVTDALDDLETATTPLGYEYLVVSWNRNVAWMFEKYQVVGGDIMFHRGPIPHRGD